MPPTCLQYLLFILTILVNSLSGDNDKLLIKHVHVLFRHGDRSPVIAFNAPNFPRFEEAWPAGIGQLTNLGVLQEFELGKWLRSRYRNFIPVSYNASDFYMRSTDVDRTLMSAQAVLAGFYHDISSPLDKYGLKWSPVPVHTVLQKNDILLSAADCPRLAALRKAQMDSDESLEFEKQHSTLFRLLEEKTNYKHFDRYNIWEVVDTVLCMKAHNMTLPLWLTKPVFDEMMMVDRFYWDKMYASTKNIARLEIGVFLHYMVEHFRSIVKDPTSVYIGSQQLSIQHVMAYSAHDTDVTYLLRAWGVFSDSLDIPYSATIMFELLWLNNTHRLRVGYKQGWMDDVGVFLQIPACPGQPAEEGCPLDVALDQIKEYVLHPKNFEAECALSLPDQRAPLLRFVETGMHRHVIYAVAGFVLFSLVFCTSIFLVAYFRRSYREIPYERYSL